MNNSDDDISWARAQLNATYGAEVGGADIESLTDEMIRAHWNTMDETPGFGADMSCFYALKRNARIRGGVHGADEFSLFCDESARRVCRDIQRRTKSSL